MKSNLALVANPQDFFRELVTEALGTQSVQIQPETEVYLVNLLNHFMTTDSLYARDANGNMREEPLALMIKEALEQTAAERQRTLFRHVGDVSLYVAGYFQESLARKVVDVDYYIDMGEKAYGEVALRQDTPVVRGLFTELSDKFSKIVEVLADVSQKTTVKKETDILRQYELWLRTGSDRAAKVLQEAGIVPNATMKPGKNGKQGN